MGRTHGHLRAEVIKAWDAGEGFTRRRPPRCVLTHVAIILVGDEVLSGHTRDANGNALAQRLEGLGYRPRRIVVVPDETAAIHEELARAFTVDPAAIVVMSGGLGPTHDDVTSEVIAAWFRTPLVMDEIGWARVVARYEHRLKRPITELPAEMVENARRMVLIPEGAIPLENPVGAATPYAMRRGEGVIIVLPGVPAECAGAFDEAVAHKLLPARSKDTVREVEVYLAESAFAPALGRIALAHPRVAIGSYPHDGESRVTVRFRGSDADTLLARDAFLATQRAESVEPRE